MTVTRSQSSPLCDRRQQKRPFAAAQAITGERRVERLVERLSKRPSMSNKDDGQGSALTVGSCHRTPIPCSAYGTAQDTPH